LNTRRLLTVGIVFLFGGEAFSLLGPMRFEHTVHFVGHVVFYAGFSLVCIGVVTHLQWLFRADAPLKRARSALSGWAIDAERAARPD